MAINEYLVSIGAIYDTKSFKKAQGMLGKSLEHISKNWDGAVGKTLKGISANAKGLKASFEPLLVVLDLTKESLMAIYDISSDISNQFVTMQSMFVDKDIRSLMAITGVGAAEAQGIKRAEELTGLNIQELPYATPAQQKLFTEFVQSYTEGLASLNQGDLETFNQTTQDFQKTIAEAKLQLQLTFMKSIIALGPELESLFGSVTKAVESFTNLVDGGGFQKAAQLFVSIIEGIVDVLTLPVNVASGIKDFFEGMSGSFGGGSTVNNINVNSNASFNGNQSEMNGQATEYARNNAYYIVENLKGRIN